MPQNLHNNNIVSMQQQPEQPDYENENSITF